MDRGACLATVHGVAKESDTTWQLNNTNNGMCICVCVCVCVCACALSVQFSCSVVSDSVTPWTAALQTSLPIINSQTSLKHMSIELVMPCNHLILSHPLLLLPSIFPSIRVFSNEPIIHIRWPKYWILSFSISPSNKYSGLISFRLNCLDLLAVQGTLRSLLQHHSSKASVPWHSAFFIVNSHIHI